MFCSALPVEYGMFFKNCYLCIINFVMIGPQGERGPTGGAGEPGDPGDDVTCITLPTLHWVEAGWRLIVALWGRTLDQHHNVLRQVGG